MSHDVINVMKNETMPSSDNKKVLMFSATVLADLTMIPKKLLEKCIILSIGDTDGACPHIEQTIIEVNGVNRRQKLKEILAEADVRGTIIFVKEIVLANRLT